MNPSVSPPTLSSTWQPTTDAVDNALVALAYMVCVDEQIHSDEVRLLNEVAARAGASEGTLIHIQRILGDTEDKLPLETALDHVSPSLRPGVLDMLAEMAWADGAALESELAFLERCASRWGLPVPPIQRVDAPERGGGEGSSTETLTLGARLVSVMNRVLGARTVEGLARIAPDGVSRRITQAQHEILLSGPGYDEAVDLCARIAAEDSETSGRALGQTIESLEALRRRMSESLERIAARRRKGVQGHAQQTHSILEGIRASLDTDVVERAEALRRSQRARQRALAYFTVAFMGRTKAGKSTLHAVVTGEGWDAVGVGRQRTTRFNRVYEWRRLRIVDTPGIGAPGGKTDEQIARSVIDEADVICYVLTDDSQQPSEFQFLQVLREHLKPLVILLNVKQNLRSPDRLTRFLKNPDRAFREEGTNGVRGHEQRIRRYATEHYGHDIFPVIPVQLLAAQMSREAEHAERAQPLLEASRLSDFLDHVRVTVLRDGPLRRSHTLLGATALDLGRHVEWLESRLTELARERVSLQNAQSRVEHELGRCAEDAQTQLVTELGKAWAQLRTQLVPFAEDHWEESEAELHASWEQRVRQLRFEEQVRAAFDTAASRYREGAAAILEEIGKEMQLSARFSAEKVRFQEQDRSMLARNLMRFGGQVLALAGTIALFFTPWGWAAVAVGTVASLLSGFFTSRAEKRRKAVEAITASLREQLDGQARQVNAQAAAALRKGTDDTLAACRAYFSTLHDGVATIEPSFAACAADLRRLRAEVSVAFGARIVDWAEDAVGQRDRAVAEADVAACTVSAQRLTLVTRRPLKPARPAEAISQVLQIPIHLEGAP